jgi:hypothetical protein
VSDVQSLSQAASGLDCLIFNEPFGEIAMKKAIIGILGGSSCGWRNFWGAPVMKKNSILVALSLTTVLMGCSTTRYSSEIPPAYVSPAAYDNMSPTQLQMELDRCNSQLSALCDRQDSAKRGDEQMSAVSWLLFWPALFAIRNEDHSSEIADLKGRKAVLERLLIQKSRSSGVIPGTVYNGIKISIFVVPRHVKSAGNQTERGYSGDTILNSPFFSAGGLISAA